MKYALLDTDFVSKTHIVRISEDRHLIDCVLEMPGYIFFCHEQVMEELSRHNSYVTAWLKDRISEGRITKYSDEQIIDEMIGLYKRLGLFQYKAVLKTACNAFGAAYYTDHYCALDEIDCLTCTKAEFLGALKSADKSIGEGNDLGEIKAYVLLQWFGIKFGNKLFYFCSDDKKARNGILGIVDLRVNCITLVSAFQRIRVETGFGDSEMKPYIQAVLSYFTAHDRQTIRVIEASEVGRVLRIPCHQVMQDIFDDKFVELQNGFLKYKP